MFSNVVILVILVSLSMLGIDVHAVMFVGILLLLVMFECMFVATFMGMTKPWFGGGGWYIASAFTGRLFHHREHDSCHVFLMFVLCIQSSLLHLHH